MLVFIVTMSLPSELQQKLEVLRQEFAKVSQHWFSEIIDILSDCSERPSEEVSGLVSKTLHDINGQAGKFGYPLISEIAHVATSVKITRTVDERAVLHLSAMFDIMPSLVADADNDGERASETYFVSVSAVGHS
ncbi:MAG: hypothetical protein VX900_15110 [Pseudomonadota bacterium]|nr:hypothetical protein [Pseudomonadota bacterium]